MPMLRKLVIAAVGAGALSLAATVPGPAQAGTLHLGSALNSISVDANVIDVSRHRASDRRRSSRRSPPRGSRYHGHYRGGFWVAPFAFVPPHPCYRWSHSRRGGVWDYRRCYW
jgi:hypothetical protein